MREIIIIQHCQSEHHINEMSGGWTDTPFTELGKKQANLIGLRLKKELSGKEYVIYSSDLKRAWQTAEILGNHLNLKIVSEKNLREINTGVAAGKTKKWANANRNPRKENKFDFDYQEFKNGETWRQFSNRVAFCMENIVESEKKNLIIVTHGGTLSFIIAWWMNFEIHMHSKSFFSASPASISLLQEINDKRHILRKLNDTSHLTELKQLMD